MRQAAKGLLTGSVLESVIDVILVVVFFILVAGLVAVLMRREGRRRAENASSGIQKAAGLSTQQDFQLNPEELDLDALCGQKKICELMNKYERDVLRAYAGGETEGELAAELLISRDEAESLVSELFARLEVNNRAELLKKLQQMKAEED